VSLTPATFAGRSVARGSDINSTYTPLRSRGWNPCPIPTNGRYRRHVSRFVPRFESRRTSGSLDFVRDLTVLTDNDDATHVLLHVR
jgi:hypothetical protein